MESLKNRAELKQYLTAFNNLNLIEETSGGYKIAASNMTIRTLKNEKLVYVMEERHGIYVGINTDDIFLTLFMD